jgi:general stress protein YciG
LKSWKTNQRRPFPHLTWVLFAHALQALSIDRRKRIMANNGNPGNFSNDREKASEAGRKGGQASTSNKSGSGSQGGGNFANDREKASEAGKKGGKSTGGSGRS